MLQFDGASVTIRCSFRGYERFEAMKTILTYGTFDMFHFGHVELLRRLKDMGDRLIVGVSTDEFNRLKGKRSLYCYEHRSKIVEAIKYVDEVIPEHSWAQKSHDIERLEVDVFCNR